MMVKRRIVVQGTRISELGSWARNNAVLVVQLVAATRSRVGPRRSGIGAIIPFAGKLPERQRGTASGWLVWLGIRTRIACRYHLGRGHKLLACR
jgi:hypothetical protein